MSVRFWEFESGGYVRLTLRHDGDSLSWESGGPTDEGYSVRSCYWELSGGAVKHRLYEHGRDCDGGYSRESLYVCPIGDLATFENPDGYMMPKWTKVSSRQWDQFAEAAGY